jgi:hypothetical protein
MTVFGAKANFLFETFSNGMTSPWDIVLVRDMFQLSRN